LSKGWNLSLSLEEAGGLLDRLGVLAGEQQQRDVKAIDLVVLDGFNARASRAPRGSSNEPR